jgi:DNA-binding response OmpR family regulator
MTDSINVLVVDDDERFCQNMAKLLRTHNLNAVTAHSGAAAIQAVETRNYHVVLLDMKMPGLSGVETMLRIREITSETQVIFLTGHASVDDALAGLNLGAFDYLLKPAPTEAIVEKIRLAYAKIQHLAQKGDAQ